MRIEVCETNSFVSTAVEISEKCRSFSSNFGTPAVRGQQGLTFHHLEALFLKDGCSKAVKLAPGVLRPNLPFYI